MFRRSSVVSSRWALWLFAAALLLKSAMPMLASASAQVQGKTVVEICTVYGVSLVALDGEPVDHPAGPAGDHPGDHAADHCTLTALTAFAADEPAALVPLVSAPRAAAAPPAAAVEPAADALARWAARLHHAPPAFA